MNIPEILDRLRVEYCPGGRHHHVRHGWVGLDCPWCPAPVGNKGKWRLGINISTGMTSCWACGGKNLAVTISQIARISRSEAFSLIEGLDLQKVEMPSDRLSGILTLPTNLGDLTHAHRQYLAGRRNPIDPDYLSSAWGAQGTEQNSTYPWRIVIPIHFQHQVVSWTARSLHDGGRWITAQPEEEKMHHRDLIYGMDHIGDTIVLVEGPPDAWRIGPGAGASFGVKLSDQQMRLVSRYPNRVICFDNERLAQRAARRLCQSLSLMPGSTINTMLESGGDPDESDPEEIKELRRTFLGGLRG